MSYQAYHPSAGQRPSIPWRSPLSRLSGPYRPELSRRRLSRVHFDDSAGDNLADNVVDSSSQPPADPYQPRWQNPIYDNGQIPVDDDHRPSDATLVTLEPPLDHLADFYGKKSSTLSEAGLKTPPQAYVLEATSNISPARKPRTFRDRLRRCNSYSEPSQRPDESEADMKARLANEKRRGFFPDFSEYYGVPIPSKSQPRTMDLESMGPENDAKKKSIAKCYLDPVRARLRRLSSKDSNVSELLDHNDPRLTIPHDAVSERDIDLYRMKAMSYEDRMIEKYKDKIRFNIVSMEHRHLFLLTFSKALMKFGAPSHRIEAQLIAAAKALDVEADFVLFPNVVVCSFADDETKTSETHFVKASGRISLSYLQRAHDIYREVMHDDVSGKEATAKLDILLGERPIYTNFQRCIFAFSLSALICPLAFGGSFLDLWIAGAGAFVLCFIQLLFASNNPLYANMFEITIALIISFMVRGLSSIKTNIFCYNAITSASIIGILPGYLILSSSLELASKSMSCGSLRMAYALLYTLFLGFSLQLGSELYLVFDAGYRHRLADLAEEIAGTVRMVATFAMDNGTVQGSDAIGIYSFTDTSLGIRKYVVDGCYRPDGLVWYLRPFPFWAQFVIVPTFSIISSLANLQPFTGRKNQVNLVVMVLISCATYAANTVANHYIFNRTDVVSAIGAFTAGLLGNTYARKMRGTAFTLMVTGVLFLVPSGLSQAEGFTGSANGVDIGGAMLAVTVGVTVGLFMSQAIVYSFGKRKTAAVMSF